MSAIRIISYNLHKGMSPLNRHSQLPQMGEMLAHLTPDILCLQEVQGQHQKRQHKIAHYPTKPHHEWLGDRLTLSPHYGQNCTYPHGHHGNAILSRFDTTTITNVPISVNRFEKRGILHCQIHPNGWQLPLEVLCCHFNLLEKDRQKQYQLLIQYVQKNIAKNAPLVVAGDFNDWTKTASHALSTLGLTEVFEQTGKSLPTFPAKLPLLSLDRLYIRHLRLEQALYLNGQEWASLSDHLPIGAVVALPN